MNFDWNNNHLSSPDSELAVLGAMMLSPEAIEIAVGTLETKDFYLNQNKVIFAAIQSISGRGEPCDLVTLAEELRRTGKLEEAGGIPFLARTLDATPTGANVEYYTKIVRGKTLLRRLLRCAEIIEKSVVKEQHDPDVMTLVDKCEDLIMRVADRENQNSGSWVGDAAARQLERLDKLAIGGKNLIGTRTGSIPLDKLTGGWQDGNLIIAAGRPGMGKSAASHWFALNAAGSGRGPAAIFSLEMLESEISQRLLSMLSNVETSVFRDPQSATEQNWESMADAVNELNKLPIMVYDIESGCSTIPQIRSKCRRLQSKHGRLSLVVIDYLGLLHTHKKSESKHLEYSEICKETKHLAGQLDCPVILLAQLNRNLEHRSNKRPELSDLRESGSIEEHANAVLFLYNESYYMPKEQRSSVQEVEFILAKHRQGDTGTVKVQFVPKYTLFRDIDTVHDVPFMPRETRSA